jgi:hypothetical protein
LDFFHTKADTTPAVTEEFIWVIHTLQMAAAGLELSNFWPTALLLAAGPMALWETVSFSL